MNKSDTKPTSASAEPIGTYEANPPKSSARSIMIVAACTGTTILNISSNHAVSMAIPKIAAELSFPSDRVAWIISAYSLSSGCLLLLFGRLADIYGRKLVWLFGAAWIIAASTGCSFAKSYTQLIILRAMHGVGPAAMIPSAVGILAHSFPVGRARSAAFAAFAAGAPLGAAIGMVFGGVMAQYASWKGVFYFITGLAAVIGAAGLFAIEPDPQWRTSSDQNQGIDWPGAFLVNAGLVMLTFSLSDAPTTGWATPLIISLLVIGVTLIIMFLLWEHYIANHHTRLPLMSLDIWTRANGRFSAMLLVTFLEWACFTTFTFRAVLYYQNYELLDPVHTMIRFLPMSVIGLINALVVALTVGILNGVYLLALGMMATSTAALLFAVINPTSPYWAYGFPAAILCVFGADFVLACGSLFVARIAHPNEQSVAGALFQTVLMLVMTFGLAITTITQAAGMSREAHAMGVSVSSDATALEIQPEVLLYGYRTAQWTSFAFGVCGLILVVAFLHDVGVIGSKENKAFAAPEVTGLSDCSRSVEGPGHRAAALLEP